MGLDEAVEGERVRLALADHEVVEHADVDHVERLAQPLGQDPVGGRWLGTAGRMLVRLLCPVFLCAVLGGQERTSWASGQNRGT